MAQTEAKQNSARRKMATIEMGSLRKNESATDKVAKSMSPNVPMGATKTNTATLRKVKIKSNIGV